MNPKPTVCTHLTQLANIIQQLGKTTLLTSSVYEVTLFLARVERLCSNTSLVFNSRLRQRFCTEKEGEVTQNEMLVLCQPKPNQNCKLTGDLLEKLAICVNCFEIVEIPKS